jgi:hypothetical protein
MPLLIGDQTKIDIRFIIRKLFVLLTDLIIVCCSENKIIFKSRDDGIGKPSHTIWEMFVIE